MRSLKIICLGITALYFMAAVPGVMAQQEPDFNRYCKKVSYTVPATVPTECPADREWVSRKVDSLNTTVRQQVDVQKDKDAGLCYSKCPSGFKGVGPVCWKQCPSGYHDDGAVCRKDAHIFGKESYERGIGILRKDAQHTSYEALLWYVPCRKGYSGVATRCYQSCPSGYGDDGATCRRDVHIFGKQTVPRGAGTVPTLCQPGIVLVKGELGNMICVDPCKTGYSIIASSLSPTATCRTQCGSKTSTVKKQYTMSADCGNYCAATSANCKKLTDYIYSPKTKTTTLGSVGDIGVTGTYEETGWVQSNVLDCQ